MAIKWRERGQKHKWTTFYELLQKVEMPRVESAMCWLWVSRHNHYTTMIHCCTSPYYECHAVTITPRWYTVLHQSIRMTVSCYTKLVDITTSTCLMVGTRWYIAVFSQYNCTLAGHCSFLLVFNVIIVSVCGLKKPHDNTAEWCQKSDMFNRLIALTQTMSVMNIIVS